MCAFGGISLLTIAATLSLFSHDVLAYTCVRCTDALSQLYFNISTPKLQDGCHDPRVQDIETFKNADYCTWMVHLKVDQDEYYKTQYSFRKPGWVVWKGYKLRENDPPPESCLRINSGFLCTCVGDYCNRRLPLCAWMRKVAKPDDPEPEGCVESYDDDDHCTQGLRYLSDIKNFIRDIQNHVKLNVKKGGGGDE